MSIVEKWVAQYDPMWVGCIVYSSSIITRDELDAENRKRVSRLPKVCVRVKYMGKL